MNEQPCVICVLQVVVAGEVFDRSKAQRSEP